jgi:hypothetical protein
MAWRALTTGTLALAFACGGDGPQLVTDQQTYALSPNGADVQLTLTAGTLTILANLCGARLDQMQAGSWQAVDPQPPIDASGATVCPANAQSLGPLGHLSSTRHLDLSLAAGTYRFVTNIEDDATDPPSHPDVPSNSFQLTH